MYKANAPSNPPPPTHPFFIFNFFNFLNCIVILVCFVPNSFCGVAYCILCHRRKIKLEKHCLGTVFTLIFVALLDLQNASDCTDFDLGKNHFWGGHAPGPP